MMISPDSYIEAMEDKSYKNLIKERDFFIREIRRFEKNKDKAVREQVMEPSPEIQYQMNLKYLAKLCELVSEVYNLEYVWGIENKIHPEDSNFLKNIEKLHTTELGIQRIKRNLSLDEEDILKWCKNKILTSNASIIKQGKNWYIKVEDCQITVNATSYTIITAHKNKV